MYKKQTKQKTIVNIMPTENKLHHATSREPFQEREYVVSAFRGLCSDAPFSQIQLLPFLTTKKNHVKNPHL